MSNYESNPTCIGLDAVFDPDTFRSLVLQGFLPPEGPSLKGDHEEADHPSEE